MEILERPYGLRAGFAPLDNIGYFTFEVNLEGEVYTYAIPSTAECCKAERVGSNKWKIRKYDFSGNPIECVIPRDMLVGFAWYNINEKLWQNSTYADTIRRCKEFFSISNLDKAKTIYQTSRGFYYYVTRFGEVYNTETMTKVKGCVGSNGYRYLNLGSVHHVNFHVNFHRLVAHHFVPKPKDLVDQTLVVNHLDGNKLNNRCDNLEWTTIKGNLEHASINGLMHTTIDKQLLEHVFKRLQEGYSDTNISRETGISVYTVNDIRRGKSPRYRTDKYTWPKHSPGVRVLDRDTIFSIYDEFTYTDKNNCEIGRQYNVSDQSVSDLRRGNRHSKLAREYITSKGLDGYWKGFSPPK